MDTQTKQIVIAFRGTEQIKIKDILTDINLAQIPYEEACRELNDVLIHKGFLTAFKSVRNGLLQYVWRSRVRLREHKLSSQTSR